MQIILGLVFLALGLGMILKTNKFVELLGDIDLLTKISFGNGPAFGCKIMGIIIIFLGTLMTVGLMDNFLGWILSPLTRFLQPRG